MARSKFFGLIARKQGLTPQEFHDHYRHPHGTMGRRPSTLRNYVQSHQINTAALGPDRNRFEAVAELWFDNENDLAFYRREPIIEQYIRTDEPNFVDLKKSLGVGAHEEVLISGPRQDEGSQGDQWWMIQERPLSIKLLAFAPQNVGDEWLQNDDRDVGRSLGVFRQTRCAAIPEIFGPHPGFNTFVGVHELWWPTLTHFEKIVKERSEAWTNFRRRTEGWHLMLAQAERFI